MKILVTGAKGFVGKNLCWALKNIRDGKDRRSLSLSKGLSKGRSLSLSKGRLTTT